MTHPTHKTRFSDSSLYDEVCTLCGENDGSINGGLHEPCTAAMRPSADCGQCWKDERAGARTRYVCTGACDAAQKLDLATFAKLGEPPALLQYIGADLGSRPSATFVRPALPRMQEQGPWAGDAVVIAKPQSMGKSTAATATRPYVDRRAVEIADQLVPEYRGTRNHSCTSPTAKR
ncbi:hypothetical protein, partial [Rhodopseudomonas sp. B29]|uniref:hypothetical protein n=1 Tax=Rhodopseudomonas sp. B29 TaxID=95607 RepID=UPI000593956F